MQRIDIHPAFISEPLFIVTSIHMSQEYGISVIDWTMLELYKKPFLFNINFNKVSFA